MGTGRFLFGVFASFDVCRVKPVSYHQTKQSNYYKKLIFVCLFLVLRKHLDVSHGQLEFTVRTDTHDRLIHLVFPFRFHLL